MLEMSRKAKKVVLTYALQIFQTVLCSESEKVWPYITNRTPIFSEMVKKKQSSAKAIECEMVKKNPFAISTQNAFHRQCGYSIDLINVLSLSILTMKLCNAQEPTLSNCSVFPNPWDAKPLEVGCNPALPKGCPCTCTFSPLCLCKL